MLRPFECDFCDKKYADLRSKTTHMINNHLQQFSCNFCHVVFKRKNAFSQHMKKCPQNQVAAKEGGDNFTV